MRWLPWLALRELWSRRGRSLLSLSALALSVGLVVATGGIGAALRASVATPAPLLGRPADLWVSSAYDVDYDLPASLAARVRTMPGVAQVQPVLRRSAHAHTPQPDAIALLGVELPSYFTFHDLTLAAGTFPSAQAPGLVALAPWAFIRDLGLGQPVTVATPSGHVTLPLTGLVEVKSVATAQQGAASLPFILEGLVLYAPLDTMADMFDAAHAITTLELRLAPGMSLRRARADVERALGPAYAVSATSLPTYGPQLWQRLILGALTAADALTLAGTAGLVYAVFASSARARRRQIGLLRVVGAVRRQVLALLLTEATLLGGAGCGIGLAVGLPLARAGVHLIFRGADTPMPLPFPAGSLPLALGLGMGSCLAGAIGPALQAAQRSPLTALQIVPPGPGPRAERGRTRPTPTEREHPPPRGGLRRLFPAEARLAAANLARERGRATLIVGTLAMVLGMALGDVGVLSLLGEELATTFGRLTGGDYLVLPGLTTISLRELAGQDTSDVPPLAPGLLAALQELRDQVWLMEGTTADIEPLQVFPGQPTLLLDIEAYARMGGFRFKMGDWPGALATFRQGPAVLLTPVVSRRLNVGLGDPVPLDTPHGPVDFSVAGIGDSEFTTCVLDLADGAAHLGASEVNAVEVQLRPGADPEVVRQTLLDAVQTHGGTLLPLTQASAQLRKMFRQARLAIGLLIGVTGLVAGLGAVNAVMASVAERRREFGLLRALGATRRQVARLISLETATLGAQAALIGMALGWIATFLFLGLARSYLGLTGEATASPASWTPLLVASAASLALWPLLAVLGGLGPALHAARLPVIQALHEAQPDAPDANE